MKKIPKAYGYCRVSTDTQELSLEAQSFSITAYSNAIQSRTPHEFMGIISDEDVSGATAFLERPNGMLLCRKLDRGDMVIVHRMDRAFRSLLDFATMANIWKRNGVELVAMDLGMDTNTDTGEMMAGIMVVLAQYERKRIGTRCRDAFNSMRRRGLLPNRSQPPSGLKPDQLGRATWDRDWWIRQARIAKMRDVSKMGFEDIAWLLTAEECKKKGATFIKSEFCPHRITRWNVLHNYRKYKQGIKRIEKTGLLMGGPVPSFVPQSEGGAATNQLVQQPT